MPAVQQTRQPNSACRVLKIPLWMYGYGLFQGSAASGDSLILFFGAAILGLSPAVVGSLDAVSSITFTVGAVSLAFLIYRMPHSNRLFVLSIVGVGLCFALFAAVNSAPLAFALAVAYGFLLAPCVVFAPLMASVGVPRSQWSEAFSHLNQVSSLGGAAGVGAAILWLASAPHLMLPDITVKLLFLGLGVMAALGALYSYLYLGRRGRHHGNLAEENAPLIPSRKLPNPLEPHARLPFLSDQFLYYLLFTFILFTGMGMSFSGIHTYLVKDLKASLALAMGALLGFKLTSYFVSPMCSGGLARLLPLQIQSLASLLRGGTVMALAAVGAFLPHSVAVPVVLLLASLWGISGGVLAVTGAEATAQLSVPGRWNESMSLYVAVSNAGAITGAWLGGILGGVLGFEAMFLISAGLIALTAVLMLRN